MTPRPHVPKARWDLGPRPRGGRVGDGSSGTVPVGPQRTDSEGPRVVPGRDGIAGAAIGKVGVRTLSAEVESGLSTHARGTSTDPL